MADDLIDKVETSIYTTPDELTTNVAFKVLMFERVPNNSRPGEKSNRVFLKHSDDVKLMFYLPAKYKFITDKEVADYNEKIEEGSNAYYVVSRGYIGSSVVTDLITKAKKETGKFVEFDPKVHKLLPGKKSKVRVASSSDDDLSPLKKFKSE